MTKRSALANAYAFPYAALTAAYHLAQASRTGTGQLVAYSGQGSMLANNAVVAASSGVVTAFFGAGTVQGKPPAITFKLGNNIGAHIGFMLPRSAKNGPASPWLIVVPEQDKTYLTFGKTAHGVEEGQRLLQQFNDTKEPYALPERCLTLEAAPAGLAQQMRATANASAVRSHHMANTDMSHLQQATTFLREVGCNTLVQLDRRTLVSESPLAMARLSECKESTSGNVLRIALTKSFG